MSYSSKYTESIASPKDKHEPDESNPSADKLNKSQIKHTERSHANVFEHAGRFPTLYENERINTFKACLHKDMAGFSKIENIKIKLHVLQN